jgi:membrane-bound lytic murein transglycosylase D
VVACDRFSVKATCRAQHAAIVAASALGLLLSSPTRAAETTHGAKPSAAASASKPASKAGSNTTHPLDAGASRANPGGSASNEVLRGADGPELRALRTAERELFLPALPAPSPPATTDASPDPSWLSRLEMPDLPVRWDERVVRYLEFFRDDPRGHATYAALYRHGGRFRDFVRRMLREKSLPEDLVWVAMIESGFDPAARSTSGAAGLWQFMPETGRAYALMMDRWLDQRFSADLATVAATDLLADLHRRFGSWELVLAAYNMGHAGLAAVVRRYNTNDFWSLSRVEGALPWETTLYVPKILAASVVAHNLDAFGFGGLVPDPPVETDPVDIPPDTPLALVAKAAACDPKELEALNPELRTARTPPAALDSDSHYAVKVPRGKGAAVAKTFVRLRGDPLAGPKPSVIVSSDEFVYPDRRRVFYRAVAGDTLREIASAMHVSPDELCRWNDLDPSARLLEGMTLQGFVMADADLSRIVVATEDDVRVLAVGSEEFFAALEQDGRFKRTTIVARTGDTLESIGKRFEVPARTMERINRRSRSEVLRGGEAIVVYVPNRVPAQALGTTTISNAPANDVPLPALPTPSPPP